MGGLVPGAQLQLGTGGNRNNLHRPASSLILRALAKQSAADAALACPLRRIEAELVQFPSVPNVEIFFSAHGVPKSYVEEVGLPCS